jgi:hypothetical protein
LAKDVPAHRVIKLTIRAATGKKGNRKFYFPEDVRIIDLSAPTPQRLKFIRRWVVRVVSVQRQLPKLVPNHEFVRRRPIAWPVPLPKAKLSEMLNKQLGLVTLKFALNQPAQRNVQLDSIFAY